MSDSEEQKVSGLAEGVERNLNHLGLQIDWMREISEEEIQYLLDHSPFLQIVAIGVRETLAEPEIIKLKTGWTALSYGDAICSSPGELLFWGGDFRFRLYQDDEDDGEGGGIVNPGKGTVYKQAFDTAAAMGELAKQLGWSGIYVVDGHPIMKWAMWVWAQENKMQFDGFNPSRMDKSKRERMRRSEVEDQRLLQRSRSKRLTSS